MKIVYVVTRADAVGGASIHVRDLARAMLDRGHQAIVLAGGEGPVTDQLGRAGVPFRALRRLRRALRPVSDLRAFGELTAVLRELRPDLVSAHTAKAGWLGRAACARLGLPAIYTPHGWAIAGRMSGSRVFRIAERAAARWARAIVCVCEYERELALRHRIAPAERLEVVRNGVRDVGPAMRARPEAEPARMVSVARFERPKDHATLLKAVARLKSRQWTLELAGNGPLEPESRRLAGELGIGERVRFLGYVADAAEALSRAQIFVLSSRSEGFPRSVLEAMRAGLPVVASDVGGIRETGAARLVEAGDAAALAAELEALIGDPAVRKRLGAAARHSYESSFRLERMLGETLALYDKIVKNASSKTLLFE
jgi:glycosyltransferase involved in cell wall biosynthesis